MILQTITVTGVERRAPYQLRCTSFDQIRVAAATLGENYALTPQQESRVWHLIEARACDTSRPFDPYFAAHSAAARVAIEESAS